MIIIIKIQSKVSLASTCPVRYRGITSDGCWLYLTRQGVREVVRLDGDFGVVDRFPTRRCYTCLCYDPCTCCFWASDGRCPCILYQLDERFREVDFIRVRASETGTGVGVITGISFDCEEKCLLLATTAGLVWVSIRDDGGLVTCTKEAGLWITGVVAAGNCYFFCYLVKGKQMVRSCSKNGEVLWECCVPKGFHVDAAVFACNPNKSGACCLFALASKHHCYPYLLECVPVDGAFCPELCCVCKPRPPCPDPKLCEDLLESIAMMQMALSDILSAEGGKLQRVIASTDDPDTLLAVNQAVNRTVVNATFLEQILFHKLELIQEICGPCQSENPCDSLGSGQEGCGCE